MLTVNRTTTGDRFRELIRSITGISLPPSKVQMIDQRLRRRVVAFGLPDTEAYLEKLLGGELPGDELRTVIDLITTNTTSFFRESEAELQRRGLGFDWAILGTDISNRMLQRATEAIYDADQLTGIPADLRARYFLTGAEPSVAGKARVVPELRRRVRFRHLNLMDETYPVDHDVQVIFLRNVLIYFDQADKERVVARLARHLAPGGYLIVGHAESMVVRQANLTQVKPTIFQKI